MEITLVGAAGALCLALYLIFAGIVWFVCRMFVRMIFFEDAERVPWGWVGETAFAAVGLFWLLAVIVLLVCAFVLLLYDRSSSHGTPSDAFARTGW